MPKMKQSIYATYRRSNSWTYISRSMLKRLESRREMGWVTLGQTFSCGHVINILGNAGHMQLVILI